MVSLFKKVRSLFLGTQQQYTAAAIPSIDYGVPVSNDSALKLTAMYAGIRIRSENIASFPKYVKRQTDEGLVVDDTHPAYSLICHEPNEYTNVFDFWFAINAALDGWGNAYAIIKRDRDGNPIALHQVHPALVSIKVVDGRKWYKIMQPDPGLSFLSGTYSDDDILHFMLVSFDGVEGVNPIVYNAIAIGKALATIKFGADFYRKGGNVKAVLETDGNLGDEAYSKFMAHFANAANNFETPLLEYGIKYKQLGISPVAAQLIQSEIISIQDICRILNIPPHMLAELSHATFSNIEHQTMQFIQFSLRPSVKRIEVELERKLFFTSERGRYSVKFDLNGMMRGDTATRSAYYHNAILDGWMSRNEAREIEGMSRQKELDKMLYPLNSGIIGEENEEKNFNPAN